MTGQDPGHPDAYAPGSPSSARPGVGPLGIVGPYPPYRGGIAHFTERLHRAVESLQPDQTGRPVVGISFSRQYPGWLYPGSSQEAPAAAHTNISPTNTASPNTPATTVAQQVSPGLPEARRVLDSMCPWTGRRAARHLRDAGVTEVAFMVWMPFFCPVYLSVLNGLRRVQAASASASDAPGTQTSTNRIAPIRTSAIRTTAIVHNAIPHEWQPFARPLMRRLLRRMDRVVALSASVADDIAELGGRRREEIEVRAHPVYNQFGEAVDQAVARRELGLESVTARPNPAQKNPAPQNLTPQKPEARTPVILFFGLVRKYKGLDVLLEAMAHLAARGTDGGSTPDGYAPDGSAPDMPAPHVVVAGEFYDDEATYRDLAARLGLSDRVHFHARYIPDEQVRLYFSAADLVVQPYRHATQSGVVQTAFQFGKPVIVTRVGGLPDMVRDGEDGLIAEPDDPASLAESLAMALQPEVLQQLAEGADRTRDASTNDWAAFAAMFDTAPHSNPEP